MGGEQSWGPVILKFLYYGGYQLFVFITKISSLFYFNDASFYIYYFIFLRKAEINTLKINPPESILTRSQPNTEALLPSLLFIVSFYNFIFC